jgi:hypothetical protein
MQEATPNRTDVLANIFTDSRFTEIRRNCWVGEVDGATVGVVLATRNPDYNTFALNKPDLQRLLDGKRNGRVDEAYIVTAHISGIQRSYCGAMAAEEVWHKIEVFGLRPRTGRFGEFFVLPPGFVPDDEDAPF